MASTKPRHIITNTQERALSTDQTNQASLHHAALLALGAAVLQGDAAYYGVVQGLLVTATGADLNVTIGTGLALRSGTAASSYDSSISWIEQRAAVTQSLAASVDGANPRWVAIEITDGSAAEAQEARQIWDPATQSFVATLVDKVRTPAPVISVRAGTAAANPVFPAGGAGVIPLAYVYLAAGALVVQATDIVMCRPMLRGDVGGDQGASGRDVWGGGVEVAAAGLAVVLRNAGGRFANHRARWGIQATDGTTAYTLAAQGMDGAALPVADDVLYFYACPAPYPSGYDSNLAPREHRPGTSALTRYQGMAAADVYNAVIVASTVEPQVNSPQGAPTAGSFSMECAPFSATGVPVTIDRSTAAYLGAAFWDFSATDLLVQDVRGALVVPYVPTSKDVDSGGAATYSLWNTTGAVAGVGDMAFPVSALTVHALIDLRDNAQNSGTVLQVRINDQTMGTLGGLLGYLFSIAPDVSQGTAIDRRFHQVFQVERSTGNITVAAIANDASDRVHIYGLAYDDAILAAR